MRILRLPEVFFNTQIVDLSRVAQEPGEGGGEGRKAPKRGYRRMRTGTLLVLSIFVVLLPTKNSLIREWP